MALALGTLTSATIMGRAATVTNTGGNNYTATVVAHGTDPEGVIAFVLNPVDLAGNAGISVNAITSGSNVTYDRTVPVITPVSISSNNAVNGTLYAKPGDTITVAYTSNESLEVGPTTTATILGQNATIADLGGFNYTATYTAVVGDPQGVVALTVNAQDLAGNAAVLVNATTDASSITFDKTAPAGYSVIIDQSLIHAGNTGGFSFTFSGGDTTAGTTYNYSISSSGGGGPVTGNGSLVTATDTISGINVAALNDGTLTLTVWQTDAAGNQGANATSTVRKDIANNGPQIVSAEYYDTDGNGRLDHVKLTFDSNVQDDSFDGYNAGSGANGIHDVTTVWQIAGRVNVALDTRDVIGSVNPADNGTNDAVLWLKFDEIGIGYDTGDTPDLTATDSSLVGLSDQCYVQTTNADCITQTAADILTVDVSEADKALPIITKVSGSTASPFLNVIFSEPVDRTFGGGCSGLLTTANFQYNDNSTNGIDGLFAMGTDANGCDNDIIQVELADGGVSANLTNNDINLDTMQGGGTAIYDASDNVLDASKITTVIGAVAPYVLSAVSTSSTTVRITFSEAMNTSIAPNTSRADIFTNYTISEDPADGACADISITAVTAISSSIYDLTNDNTQCATTTYKVQVAATVIDQNENLSMTSPNFANFVGLEELKVVSAICTDQSHIQLTFNKDVQTGGGVDPTNTADRITAYKLTGATDLGPITSAVVSANTVTIAHTNLQSGGTYTVIASNGTDGDGFDDAGVGAIQVNGFAEDLLASPNDRASFLGCGTEVVNFTDGPISSDPFGDSSDFGYVTTYDGKIFIGPNTKGNGANRFEPAGANPTGVTFSFTKDTINGAGDNDVHNHSGAGPFYTIGHSGCIVDSADKDLSCGPDNEDGRGIFVSGTIGGTEYLFITGGRSGGDNDYLYWTTNTDTILDFNYIDLGATFNPIAGNKGTESIYIFNNKAYWSLPGDGTYRPYVVKLNNFTADGTAGTDSLMLEFRHMTGIGYGSFTSPNIADMVGGLLYGFNDRLYFANSGSITDAGSCNAGDSYSAGTCEQTGGIVRSINNDPAACTAADTCNDWVNITPTANTDYTGYFSIVLNSLSDLIPADRPIPAMTSYQGKLFMIRNACTVSMVNRTCTGSGCSDDVSCSAAGGTTVPQLWKCDPTIGGNVSECDANEWTLVAENGATGKTNMNDGNNTHVTLLVANGSYLYVGFDNATTGVEIWRTNVANPTAEGDFFQIGLDGLGNAAANQQIYSATSVQDGIDYYLYVSTGKSGSPVSVYRQKNN